MWLRACSSTPVPHVMCLWIAGPMDFTSMIGNPHSDAAFLALLKKETSPATRKAAPKQAAKTELTEGQIRKLKLKESDVAKVTREGISPPAVPPHEHRLSPIGDGRQAGDTLLFGMWTRRLHRRHAHHLSAVMYTVRLSGDIAGDVKSNEHAHASCNWQHRGRRQLESRGDVA